MTVEREQRSGTTVPSTDGRGPTALRPVRVAIVEDDADIRAVLSSLLRLWGHEVVGEACTGMAGVDLLVSTRPELALIDIGLPGLDGCAVAEQARMTLGQGCPRLVAMTGLHRADQMEGGAFDLVLIKPPEPNALLAVLGGTAGDAGPAAE